MSRTKVTGPLYGSYINYRLIARLAVTNGQSNIVVDRIFMPADFVPLCVSFDGKGVTATVTAAVTNLTGGAGTGAVTVSSGVPAQVLPATIATNSFLSVPQGDALRLLVSCSGGAGASGVGQVTAHVWGYHSDAVDHGRYSEHGQTRKGGPEIGRYDCITFTNLIAPTPGGGSVAVNSVKAPFACRSQAISFSATALVTGTGTITAKLRNDTQAVDLQTATVDMVAGAGGARIDMSTGVKLSNRDIARGDVLTLYLSAGGADAVPVVALNVFMQVWVRGHVDFTGINTEGNTSLTKVYNNLSGVGADLLGNDTVGPGVGGLFVIPFINSRAPGASNLMEASAWALGPLKIIAVTTDKQVAGNSIRYIAKGGVQVTNGGSTLNYVLRNEPANLAGNVVANTLTVNMKLPGDTDSGLKYPRADSVQFFCGTAGSAAGAITLSVLCRLDEFVDLPATQDSQGNFIKQGQFRPQNY